LTEAFSAAYLKTLGLKGKCCMVGVQVGNMVFWFFFCIVGQPMCLLLYYHDVVNEFQTMSSSEKH
jgi:hypothetical protein